MRRREGDLRQVGVGVGARAPLGKEKILVVSDSDRGSVPRLVDTPAGGGGGGGGGLP